MTFKEFVAQKVWSANKAEVLDHWRKILPDQPLDVTPVPLMHQGTRYDEDGIRISGHAQFINSVLSRIKDLIQYEAGVGTELDIEYKQAYSKGGEVEGQRFVCYIHVMQKEPKKLKPPSSSGKTSIS